jgi:SAM-dependent methyltransferase
MSLFAVGADDYDRFMGRYSVPLAARFADGARLGDARAVLDVGCGPGALTRELLARGLTVTAVDPQPGFADAARARNPGADVQVAAAEDLPFADGTFDAALAQLVVHFMADPVAGLREMRRVTRPGGVVTACVWDHAGRRGPLSVFWEAAGGGEEAVAGASAGDLERLFAEAGMREVEGSEARVTAGFSGFDDWWQPFTSGMGYAGKHLRTLSAAQVTELRERCRALLPDGPFELDAVAWTARGLA